MTDAFPLDDDEVWVEIRSAPRRAPALFLDRDGCVIVDTHYLHEPEKCELIPGAAETIRAANRAGWHVCLVTNQGGIGRGYYGWREFHAVQERLLADLTALDARVDSVCAAPFHPQGQAPYDKGDHPARKPGPQMLLRAAAGLDVDLAASWMAGDLPSDMLAGRNAGVAGGLHLRTGFGEGQVEKALAVARADFTVHALGSIAEIPARLGLAGAAEA